MQLEPVVTADEIRAAEEAHPGHPESMAELMERAGAAVARVVDATYSRGRVTVVCGKGSNGGDGKVAARHLREAGWEATVVEEFGELGEPAVVIDALFGTGFRGAPREDAARMIEAINGCGCPVVSIDVPSGVDASTGEVPGAAVRAALTVTMQVPKLGLVVAPGRFHAGEVRVVNIGLAVRGHANALVPASIAAVVPRKERETNKYRAGSVLVVGGSRGLTGAPSLTAEAAFRADAGYVTVAAPASAMPVLEARLLEAVKRPLPEDGEGRLLPRALPEVLDLAERASAVALGPGLGRSDGTRELVRRLLEELSVPVVVDADGLWELEPVERARTPARRELRVGGRAPARGRAPRRRALRLRLPAQGLRHARGRAGGGGARLALRRARARDRRHRRRADGHPRRVPREGDGGAARRRGGRGGARARREARPRPAGPRRRRPARDDRARARRRGVRVRRALVALPACTARS
jgi:NAD(P)H-hydrate epimerase